MWHLKKYFFIKIKIQAYLLLHYTTFAHPASSFKKKSLFQPTLECINAIIEKWYGPSLCQLIIVLYCIVFIHFYSASHSLSFSEALPTTETDTVSEFTRRSATAACSNLAFSHYSG